MDWSRWVTFLAILAILAAFVFTHEGVHYVVYKEFGCTNVTFGATLKGELAGVQTTATCQLSADKMLALDTVQAQAEIVHYPMLLIVMLLALILLHGPIVILVKKEP